MRRETVLVVAYLVVWAFSLVAFWLFMGESDAMAFSLIFFYALIPAAAAGVSFSIGRNDCFGKAKWLVPIALGIMHMLAEYLTFSMKNMVAFYFAKINRESYLCAIFHINGGDRLTIACPSIPDCSMAKYKFFDSAANHT